LEEKIEILVLLSGDRNEESRYSAFETLQSWPVDELQHVLTHPSTPAAVLDFVAYNLTPDRKDLGDALLQNPSLPDYLREWLEKTAALFAEAESSGSSEAAVPLQADRGPGQSAGGEEKRTKETLVQRIHRMSVLEKVKSALTGHQEERAILVRDPNKMVARAILQSPKLSEQEVENFAAMRDVDEEVLRLIAANRKFMKNYEVIRALINNPRTPIDVGLPLIKRTHYKDLKGLVLNRNVADVIREAARRRIRQQEEAGKPKFMNLR
jgi:hypothetical protein